MSALLRFVGSVLFGTIFIAAGLNAIQNYDGMLAHTAHKMAALPFQLTPELVNAAFAASIVLKMLGAALIILGAFSVTLRRLGAVTLLMFLLPVTFIVHDFWNLQDSNPAKVGESINFFKNLALMGALICFLADAHSHAAPSKVQEGSKRENRATGRKNNKKVD